MILIGFRNSVFYLVVGTFVNLVLTTLGAYALSRKKVLLGPYIMFAIAFTMFFQGGLIPMYILVRMLGLLNTRAALIIPHAIHAYNLIIMRTYFVSIPDSFEESAKLDGANDFTILLRIMLPLAMPVVAVMVLFYGVWHWNSWFRALIFLSDRVKYPIQLVLREILLKSETDSMVTEVATADKKMYSETVKYAAIVVANFPILFIYPFLQRYFVRGVMIGGIKG
jgi:putative aldouronate transport system permease protein